MLTLFIQVGVGLIQYHQFGSSVEGPGQADALALAAREHHPPFPDARIIAPRKLEYQFMDPCLASGRNHLFGIDLPQAGNIFSHGTGEEFHVLRQVADMGAQPFLVPGVDIRPVQADLAPTGRPDPQHEAAKGRFTGTRRANQAQGFSRLEGKMDIAEDIGALQHKTHMLDHQLTLGIGEVHARGGDGL